MDDTHGCVRRPCAQDVAALVALEMEGFAEVYGRHPERRSGGLVARLTEQFEERVRVLGPYSLVHVDETGVVDSMLIACPTSVAPTDFLALGLDMTTTEGIAALFDARGPYRYFVNLVSIAHGVGRIALFHEILARSLEEGIVGGYFESRLPGFAAWAADHGVDTGADRAELAGVAVRYATAVGPDGAPIDPLLGMYAACGARPLHLVPDAWAVDVESLGFGVLCHLPNRLLLESGVAPGSPAARHLAAAVRDLPPWDCVSVLATGRMPAYETLVAA